MIRDSGYMILTTEFSTTVNMIANCKYIKIKQNHLAINKLHIFFCSGWLKLLVKRFCNQKRFYYLSGH